MQIDLGREITIAQNNKLAGETAMNAVIQHEAEKRKQRYTVYGLLLAGLWLFFRRRARVQQAESRSRRSK